MNRNFRLFAAVGVMVIGLTILGIGLYNGKDNKKSGSNSQSQNSSSTDSDSIFKAHEVSDMCTVFTLEDAKKLIGATATTNTSPSAQTSSSDISVSSCTYSTPMEQGGGAKTIKVASILARSAKTKNGAESNKLAFGSGKPAGVQDVSGLGVAAYWNQQFGQLNLLIGDNWYIVSIGQSIDYSSRSVDDAKKMAQELLPKLKAI